LILAVKSSRAIFFTRQSLIRIEKPNLKSLRGVLRTPLFF
jgi:hypothetical protein